MRIKLRFLSLFLLIITVAPSCKKDKTELKEPHAYYVSATPAGSYTKNQLQALAGVAGFGGFNAAILYDVDFVKIVYKTTYKGETVEASGLLGIPKGTPSAPSLLSAQHGTQFLDSESPSNFPLTFSGFELFASAGFITLIPDYLGYGSTKDLIHPYYDANHSASTVIDMIKAVKFYLEEENIGYSPRLFLAGYSEGGYVSLAAQKEIESNATHNLSLTAVVSGAGGYISSFRITGGYDLPGMMNIINNSGKYAEPSFLSFLLQAYNATYKWNRPLTDFFSQSYANKIPNLLNGSTGKTEINSHLNTNTYQLFSSSFCAALGNPAEEIVFKKALADNSFPNWYPKTPTRLYHGTEDQTVFFQTTQSAFTRFVAAGASNLQLIPIPGGTHQTSIQPMMLDALPWLKALDH